MCERCNYPEMLSSAGLSPTAHRVRVLEAIGNNHCPLNAQEIYDTLQHRQPINRVTVYRILDSLVANGLVDRISGGRAAFFGLAPNGRHQRHPHFYCRRCGRMNCLNPKSISMDMKAFERIFPGKIDNVEVRVEGICKNCLEMVSERF
jgi:Fur family transcriptional regulator, ferric uptake regulator